MGLHERIGASPAVLLDASLRSIEIGRVGENLAAFYLESLGIGCTIVDRRGSDIWCSLPNGHMLRIEVKTATKMTKQEFVQNGVQRCYEKYYFGISKTNLTADYFCFVNLTNNIVLFVPRSEMTEGSSKWIKEEEFTERKMKSSLRDMLLRHVCDLPESLRVTKKA